MKKWNRELLETRVGIVIVGLCLSLMVTGGLVIISNTISFIQEVGHENR